MIFFLLVVYAFLASSFTIGKIVLCYVKPIFLIAFRMIIAGILLLGYRFCIQRKKLRIAQQDYGIFLLLAFFHIYMTFLLEFWALQYVPSAKTTLIYATTPFFSILFSYLIVKQRPTKRQICALIIGFSGLIPFFISNDVGVTQFSSFFTLSLPELALLGSVMSATYAWFIIKDLLKKGYSMLHINGLAMLIGGSMSLITSWILEGITPPINNLRLFFGWTFLLICIGNIVVYNLYGWLLNFYSITFVTFTGFLCPIFGGLFGWYFLNEAITWHYFLALVLVIIGLYFFYTDESKHKN